MKNLSEDGLFPGPDLSRGLPLTNHKFCLPARSDHNLPHHNSRTAFEHGRELHIREIVVDSDVEPKTLQLVGQIIAVFNGPRPRRHPIKLLVIEDECNAAPRMTHVVFFGVSVAPGTSRWRGVGVPSVHQISDSPGSTSGQFQFSGT
jgi:hypothetical protein